MELSSVNFNPTGESAVPAAPPMMNDRKFLRFICMDFSIFAPFRSSLTGGGGEVFFPPPKIRGVHEDRDRHYSRRNYLIFNEL